MHSCKGFDNYLLVLKKLNGVRDIGLLGFDRVEFWVQRHNAQLLCMTKAMGEFLGRLIGDLVDIDVRTTWECFGKYLRVRVAIDVSKTLNRFLRLDLSWDGTWSLLLFRYESLTKYCFYYGVLGHLYSECLLRKDKGVHDADTEFDCGLWM
ncbi:hypothetical protein Ddye_010912 [Dipteronia dyeriana]|uniref:Zinc knuckle CX2CX4HX4C domain-containing protein n=1 Tax=Dipteronia dyeriana TaxID=168575 RepID=A0AAD9XEI2_9ROSI|nr:hypothetical protein Ddye_010912 [Dipteronia dyeriana]